MSYSISDQTALLKKFIGRIIEYEGPLEQDQFKKQNEVPRFNGILILKLLNPILEEGVDGYYYVAPNFDVMKEAYVEDEEIGFKQYVNPAKTTFILNYIDCTTDKSDMYILWHFVRGTYFLHFILNNYNNEQYLKDIIDGKAETDNEHYNGLCSISRFLLTYIMIEKALSKRDSTVRPTNDDIIELRDNMMIWRGIKRFRIGLNTIKKALDYEFNNGVECYDDLCMKIIWKNSPETRKIMLNELGYDVDFLLGDKESQEKDDNYLSPKE